MTGEGTFAEVSTRDERGWAARGRKLPGHPGGMGQRRWNRPPGGWAFGDPGQTSGKSRWGRTHVSARFFASLRMTTVVKGKLCKKLKSFFRFPNL
jgi:hypothetical protein